jgi:hypothetical protein
MACTPIVIAWVTNAVRSAVCMSAGARTGPRRPVDQRRDSVATTGSVIDSESMTTASRCVS